MAAFLELEKLAGPAYTAPDLVQLRHGAVFVVETLDREHRAAHARQVVVADVPAAELRIKPDLGPAVEGLARVPVVAAELLGEVGGLEGVRRLADRRDADWLD